MNRQGAPGETATTPLTARLTARQHSTTLTAIAVLILAYGICAPFSAMPLPRFVGFVPATEGMACIADLATAVFLYSQFSIARSRALLVLSSGYAFVALIVFVHILTFPGVVAPAGALGAGTQTAAWLFILWHLIFPISVICYALAKDKKNIENIIHLSPAAAVLASLAIVIGSVVLLTWGLIAGNDFLPPLIRNGIEFLPMARYVARFGILVCVLALVLLWFRQTSVLDRWLMVSVGALTADLALRAFIMVGRYELGFYASRVFAVVSSVVVLTALHGEVARQYSRMLGKFLTLRREQESRLLSLHGIVGSIAHEIHQPMAAIALEGHIARKYLDQVPPNIDEARVSLDAIAQSAFRSSELIRNIRDLLKTGNQQMSTVDVNETVAEALARVHETLKAHAISLELSSASDLPKIRGHKGQLVQVLLNVLHNAVDALDGAPNHKRMVRIETERHGLDSIVIGIEDSGPGIDSKIADEIFDTFMTTKPSGMGLGLSLCRVIIEHHDGKIVTSRGAMGGAQFQIFLPASAS